ncbi:hypothetical protein JVT61DRAFT_10319 [Boletus reticuloceps]|uniref:Uncharacterized protein n=1 Tax=Boletus reticuloceps TaxID=495285 RepID=A0A8I2YW96_9AGAM|nr:hypothetical protein JVT61DRAFT_10319 [Boletus reticuloceps]
MDSVRSIPSPNHHCAKEDIGTVTARTQITKAPFMDLLCPLQLLYNDGVERLAAESASQRVRWVGAIWYAIFFYFCKCLSANDHSQGLRWITLLEPLRA